MYPYIVILTSLLIIIVCGLLAKQYTHRNIQHFMTQNNVTCIYAYYEKNKTYADNFRYFLYNGGIIPNVKYYIVINGEFTVNIPRDPNIIILHRENKGYDFGAWGYALTKYHSIFDSDYIFFMNTSVKGPYSSGKDWTNPFIELFSDSDVKLVGTSINICSQDFSSYSYGHRKVYPHVQSMFFCVDREALRYLWNAGIFEVDENISFDTLIGEKEVGMSMILLNNNWNINSILSKYQGIDYRKIEEDINFSSRNGDPYYDGAYFGESIRPEEVIFFKNTRFN